MPQKSPMVRFAAKVDITQSRDVCWPWTGYIDPQGYPKFKFAPDQIADRAAYRLLRGPIPDGLRLRHLCGSGTCVNPWHMEPFTVTRTVPTCAHPEREIASLATGECKMCHANRWKREHPEAAKAHKRAEYWRHRGKYRADAKVYYAKNAERIRAYSRAWAVANPIQRRNTDLQRNYGITVEQFRDHLVGQAGRCLICLTVPEKLVVDHDHATGKFRGLLCQHCNRAIGHLRENVQTALSAIRYLERAR